MTARDRILHIGTVATRLHRAYGLPILMAVQVLEQPGTPLGEKLVAAYELGVVWKTAVMDIVASSEVATYMVAPGEYLAEVGG